MVGSMRVRLLVAIAAFVLVSCGSDCAADQSCFPLGTYIETSDGPGAKSAEICVDSDCSMVGALAGADDVFDGFNVDTWHEGRTVQLRLTVFDGAGEVIDSLTEQREMDSSDCGCGVLFYDWKDGRLHRLS